MPRGLDPEAVHALQIHEHCIAPLTNHILDAYDTAVEQHADTLLPEKL